MGSHRGTLPKSVGNCGKNRAFTPCAFRAGSQEQTKMTPKYESKKPVLQYSILKHTSLVKMTDHVNAVMAEGWCPLGGVNFAGGFYFQAIRKITNLPIIPHNSNINVVK